MIIREVWDLEGVLSFCNSFVSRPLLVRAFFIFIYKSVPVICEYGLVRSYRWRDRICVGECFGRSNLLSSGLDFGQDKKFQIKYEINIFPNKKPPLPVSQGHWTTG